MDMKAMHDLKYMLCKEIDKIAKKGELTAGSLETVHKLTDTVKNIDKIMMLEDEGYSERGGYSQRRDSRGRYSRDDGMDYSRNGGMWNAQGSYGGGHAYDDGGSSYGDERHMRYSREDGKEHMMRTFGELMEGANTEQRRIIQRAMDELRKA